MNACWVKRYDKKIGFSIYSDHWMIAFGWKWELSLHKWNKLFLLAIGPIVISRIKTKKKSVILL